MGESHSKEVQEMPRRIRATRTRPRDHEIIEEEDMTFGQLMDKRGIKPHHTTRYGRRVWRI